MNIFYINQSLLILIFLFPLLSFVVQVITYPFLKLRLPEVFYRKYFTASGLLSIVCAILLYFYGLPHEISLFGASVQIDEAYRNISLLLASLILLGVVSYFSFDYLHKEIGFYKFFLNFTLFWMGILVFIFAKDDMILFSGWEFIGISSIFLISFYDYRAGPIRNSITVMSFYKVADIVLITSLLSFSHLVVIDSIHKASIESVALFGIIVSGLIKSGSFPFSSWLPKALEGPTPSSAVYYAALSVNTGVILLIKYSDQIVASGPHQMVLLIFGALTFLYSSIVSRIQTDAKNALVYSATAQTGIVLVELAFGYTNFAIFHLYSSSFLKTYQFLRSPSYLHVFHQMEGEHGKVFAKTGVHFEKLLPKTVREKLYKITYNHFYIDDFYDYLGWVVKSSSKMMRQLFLPIISFSSKESQKILLWPLYFIFAFFIVNNNTIIIGESFVEYIPIVLLVFSMVLFAAITAYEFIAAFVMYKILEIMIVHSVHLHTPLKYAGVTALIIFVMSLYRLYSKSFTKQQVKQEIFLKCLVILSMLYFTNFPFMLQSLMNEHLIEHFLEDFNMLDLVMYGLANTLFNIAIYKRVFKYVYLRGAQQGALGSEEISRG